MEGIEAIVFDWDGTVVDTMPGKIRNAGLIFQEAFAADPAQVAVSYRKYSGIPRRELFERIAEENVGRGLGEEQFRALSLAFTSRNLRNYESGEVLDDESRTALQDLRAEGYRLFVSSSATQEEIGTGARMLGIDNYFEAILGSREGFRKGKEHIDFLRRQFGLKSAEIVFVGDEKADMRLAGRLGLRTIGIARDKPSAELREEFADHVVGRLSELRAVLDGRH